MLDDLVSTARIMMDLRPMEKSALLREMTQRLADAGEVENPEALAEILIRREAMVSTGVKTGFAFPHAFSPALKDLRLAIGVVREGTDYQSHDGQPVEFIFLVVGPPQGKDTHLRVLARLSRITSEEGMLQALREAPDANAVAALLCEADRRMPSAN